MRRKTLPSSGPSWDPVSTSRPACSSAVAADAGWSSDIGDAGFNALTTNLDIADWVEHATAPQYVHQHNQATASEDILDLMGNGHVATGAISGTTDAAGIAGTSMDTGTEPTGWTYYGVAAPSGPPILVMAPPIPA